MTWPGRLLSLSSFLAEIPTHIQSFMLWKWGLGKGFDRPTPLDERRLRELWPPGPPPPHGTQHLLPLPLSPCFYSGKLAPLPLRTTPTTPQVRRVERIRTPDHDYPRWSVGFCFWDTWARLPAMAGWCLLLGHLGTQAPKRSLMYIVNWAQPAENWVFVNSVETSRHNYQTIVVLK